jgi:hypothetical protein
VAALQAAGATFDLGRPFGDLGALRPMTEPGGHLEENGSLLGGLEFRHPLLMPDTATFGAIHSGRLKPGDGGVGRCSFLADSRTVVVSQNAEFADDRSRDGVADGLLALALRLYTPLRPTYGWVDEVGWNEPSDESIDRVRPRFVFWATFYGPEYVEALGRDFLKQAPGWVVVDLEDGGLLLVARESYEDWWHHDPPGLLEHFRARRSRIRIYRAQPFPF